jgi:SOS response regulatory protein OraA/RecX
MKRTFNRSSAPVTPFDRALRYLSVRQRSIKEIHDYLAKKEYSEADYFLIQKTV